MLIRALEEIEIKLKAAWPGSTIMKEVDYFFNVDTAEKVSLHGKRVLFMTSEHMDNGLR